MQTIQKGQHETQTANQNICKFCPLENFSWLKPRTVWHAINFLRPGWHTQFTNPPFQFAEPCYLPLYPSCSRELRSPSYGDQRLREEGRAVSQWKQCQGQKSYLLAFWLELFFFTSLQTICAPSRIGFSEPKGKSEKDCLLVGSLLNSTVELNYGENYCLRIPRSNIERGTRTHLYIYIYIKF